MLPFYVVLRVESLSQYFQQPGRRFSVATRHTRLVAGQPE